MGPEDGLTVISFILHVSLLSVMGHECGQYTVLSQSVACLSCGGDGHYAMANADQDKLSALQDIVLKPFHAARPEGQAVVCGSGLSLHRISPSDNLVATEAGVCLVVDQQIV